AWAANATVTVGRASLLGTRDSLALRLGAFFAFASFASLHYATLLLHPPAARVFAVVAAATAGGGALALSGRIAWPAPLVRALRALVVLVVLCLGLLAIGVPARLLLAGHWATLAHDAHRGLDDLAGWLWPYRDGHAWARVTVLAVLPVGLLTAAGLCFWPSARAVGARRLAGLSLLIAIFITGAANERGPASGFQGVALLALVAAWLWLPTLGPTDVNRAARWLLACGALALGAAPALGPRGPWIDYRAWSPLALEISFQWDQLYGPIPWSRSTATMFEITRPIPGPVKVTSLDRFDGVRFLRSYAAPGSSTLDLPGQPGAGRWYQRATVTVAALRSNLVLSTGLPVSIRWLSAHSKTAIRGADGTTVLPSTLSSGERYSVISYVPAPTSAALRRAPRRFPRAYLPYAQFELPSAPASAGAVANRSAEARASARRVAVLGAPAPGRTPASDPAIARRIEASPYGPMFALARRIAAGARTDYDIAQRIQRFLLANYSYDETVPVERYPLESFLFRDRRGYCQQFSGAMTLMLRMDGVPARVAAGFGPGIYRPASGDWLVRALDAHSWVEVYFSGVGWVGFDPTPPRAVVSSHHGLAPSSSGPPSVRTHPGAGVEHGHAASVLARGRLRRRGSRSPWLIAAAALAGLLASGLLCSWLAGARRLRRALAGDATGAVAELH
ncbi:MAG: transglutaminase-like domain-containing protein, partial [Actinomycetota bacterium]|nr:transglutaminase-like domain-containing protein [Actinomycetota bacterium]